MDRQITKNLYGHILTNSGVWSSDGQWLVYDVRSDVAGNRFDGTRIERVHVPTGEVQILYESKNQACCGVVTCSPLDHRFVFMHGPEHPDHHWAYCAYHRYGVIGDFENPKQVHPMEACNFVPPFLAGALRGGSHVHTFDGLGQWIAFTYEDHVLAELGETGTHDWNQRNIGVSAPLGPVLVNRQHPRNHDGSFFSVLVTKTVNQPKPGSDEICRAFEEGWIGQNGYLRSDGSWQQRALAFQGQVVTESGQTIREVFVVDVPENITIQGEGPLEGTSTLRPAPPKGTRQRRLTFTSQRKNPGIQGPRHWLRSSPDGSQIAFLMKDDAGIVQLWTISPNGGEPRQITSNPHDVTSAFSWNNQGTAIAHSMDHSICVTHVQQGTTSRFTPCNPEQSPRPEACVFSPDGSQIAYVRTIGAWNQIFVVDHGS